MSDLLAKSEPWDTRYSTTNQRVPDEGLPDDQIRPSKEPPYEVPVYPTIPGAVNPDVIPAPQSPLSLNNSRHWGGGSPYVLAGGSEEIRLCCVGFNHETSECCAIIEVPRLKIEACKSGLTLNVVFTIVFSDGSSHTVGQVEVNVFSELTQAAPSEFHSVSVILPGNMSQRVKECGDQGQTRILVRMLGEFNGKFIISNQSAAIQFPQISDFGSAALSLNELRFSPSAAALLPSGKVLLMGGDPKVPLSDRPTVALYDPNSNTINYIDSPRSAERDRPYNLYAAGLCVLMNGNVLMVGGTGSVFGGKVGARGDNDQTFILATDTLKWSKGPRLVSQRIAPTLLTWPDGNVQIFGGRNSTDPTQGPPNNNREMYEVATNSIVRLPELDATTHTAQGRVIASFSKIEILESRIMSSQRADMPGMKTNKTAVLDFLGRREWSSINGDVQPDLDETSISTPLPSWPAEGLKRNILVQDNQQLLTYENQARSWRERVWRVRHKLEHNRAYGQAVLLADGTVLLAGGVNVRKGESTKDVFGLARIDLYDPVKDIVVPGGSLKRVRNADSTALLLRTGEVLFAGSRRNGFEPITDSTLEIYRPDYLWRGPRPIVKCQQKVWDRESYVELTLGERWTSFDIGKIAIYRCSSTSHGNTPDARYIRLDFVHHGVGNRSIRIPFYKNPLTSSIAPPGYYMLFVLSVSGVPSMAESIYLV